MYSFLFKNRLVKIVFNLGKMKQLLESLFDVIFPTVCNGCETVLNDNEYTLCSYCRYELPKTNHLKIANNESFEKFYGLANIHKAASLLYYEKEGVVQKILHNLKYKNKQEIGKLMANMFEEDLNSNQFFEINTCIVPVPLHPKKLKERGDNQISSFCETLCKNHDLDYETNVLKRRVYNKTQTTKNLLDRNNAYKENSFYIENNSIKAKHIVIVDDVLTTGSTLLQCIKALESIQNKNISILTIAFAHS